MTKKEQQADKDNLEKPKTETKEINVNLGELLAKVKAEAVAEMKKDFVTLAYRLMAAELCIYKLINKDVPDEFKQDILKQEDFLSANVETILRRLKEIEVKVEEEKQKQLNDKLKENTEKSKGGKK